jgi:hypothetical protein
MPLYFGHISPTVYRFFASFFILQLLKSILEQVFPTVKKLAALFFKGCHL